MSEALLIGATLTAADLSSANLAGASLKQARLDGAEMTGVRLHGAIRDGWNIKRVKCRYVYLDSDGVERTPEDRDYAAGEFSRLFGLWGTFALVFQKEVSFAELIALNHTVLRLDQAHPDWDLRIHSLCIRGTEDEAVLSFDESRAGKAEIRAEIEREFPKMQREVDDGLRRLDQLPDSHSLAQSLREPIWLDLNKMEPAVIEGRRGAAGRPTVPRPAAASNPAAKHVAPE